MDPDPLPVADLRCGFPLARAVREPAVGKLGHGRLCPDDLRRLFGVEDVKDGVGRQTSGFTGQR